MKRLLFVLLLLLCTAICIYSGSKLYTIFQVYEEGNNTYEAVSEQFVTPATLPEPQKTEETSMSPEETEPTETIPRETAPVAVNFEELLNQNPDVVGWLYSPDTPINYPLVQSDDNDYYLHRLLNGATNANGTIFLDYRNSPDFSDWNTILYGHNMQSGAMFGTIQRYKQQAYYEAHPCMYLLTPDQDYQIDLISGYTTHDNSPSTYGFPENEEERDVLLNKALENTTFDSWAEIGGDCRLITMSTCAYEFQNARYVLVGILRPLDS